MVGVHPDWARLLGDNAEIATSHQATGGVREGGGHPMRHLEPVQILPLASPDTARCETLTTRQDKAGAHRLLLMPNEHMAYLESGQDSYY